MKLIINGKEYDFSSNTVQALLSSGIEGTEFHKQSGRRMLPVSLPLTANNQKTNNISDWGSIIPSNDLNYENIFKVVIEEKGSELLVGNGRMKEVNSDTFTIEAWGDASDWVPAMREIVLADLAPDDFIWDSADIDNIITACATDSPYDAGFERCYPAIVYKPVTDGFWLYDYMYPAIPVLSLIERFFGSIQPIGFTIQSEFLYSDFFKRLILPYGWGTFGMRDEQYNLLNTDFKASITTVWYGSNPLFITPDSYHIVWDDETTPPNFDNAGMYDNSNGQSVITENGVYRIRIEKLKPIPLVSGQGYTTGYVYLNLNGTRIFIGAHAAGNGEFNYDALRTLDAGDIVFFEGSYYIDIGNPATSAPVYYNAGTVNISKLQSYQLGDTVSWAEILPDNIYFDDFWTGLKQLFNLYIETDKTRGVVTIEPLFSWEYGAESGKGFIDETLDVDVLDSIQNLQSDIRISYEDIKQTLKFKFRNDPRDGYMSRVEKENNIDLYSVIYHFPPTFESGDDEEVNKVFSAVVHTVIDGSAFPVMVSDIEANIADNYDSAKTNFQSLKLLYYRGTAYGNWNFNGVVETSYPKAFALDVLAESNFSPALTYTSHDFYGTHYQGLFSKHWWRYMASLRLPFYQKLSVRMPNTYFANLSHRNLRSYNGILCLLENVSNYSPVNESDADFKLRQFITPLSGEEIYIEETPNSGVVDLILLECYSQINFTCSQDGFLGEQYVCFWATVTQSENANSTIFVWVGYWIPLPVEQNNVKCLQPVCNQVCLSPVDVFVNTIDAVSSAFVGATNYVFYLTWDAPAEEDLINQINSFYQSCNGLLTFTFDNDTYLSVLKSQVTDFICDETGITIYYDSSLPFWGVCQSMQQTILDNNIIPSFIKEDWENPSELATMTCCNFEMTDNELLFKITSCNGQEKVYLVTVTDTENPCENYVITQITLEE